MSSRRFSMHAALLAGVLAASGSAFAQMPVTSVSSPDGAIQLRFSILQPRTEAGGAGQLAYDVTFHGKPVMVRSALGLEIQGQPKLGAAVAIADSTASKIDETYTIPVGKSSSVRDACNTLSLELTEPNTPGRHFTVEARAYDDGIAFRYILPKQQGLDDVRLANEATQFQFSKDGTAYPLLLRNFRTSWEDNYHIVPISAIHPESIVALPFLVELPGIAWVALTEANIENYAGMYLTHSENNARMFTARLAPKVEDATISVSSQPPVRSAWRTIMIADAPGRLVESNLVLTLNPPSAIADTSWIKAGKAAWDWWSGSYAEGVDFKPGMNTATMKHYIDFASKSGFEYMLIDAGWAARAPAAGQRASDITRTQPNIDMPGILRFAKERNVKVWLWAHWTDIDRQMDDAFPLFEKWGVAGVKIDFMDRDDQWMVGFYHRVVKLAAQHHLMIDFHGAYKPDGLRRTYPNLMTREGILGQEYNKWSARDTPDHHVIVPFTRMLAGPLDYTPGGFRNVTPAQFESRSRQPMVMGTRAHQLALFVVFESPFEMVSDYPEAYAGEKDFDFIRAVPATWDETRVINARVGDYVTIARRRGSEWYVGSIAGSRGADLRIPLQFLGSGSWVAETYSDAGENPTRTAIETKPVTAASVLAARLVSGGGQAIRIRPAR